MGHDARVRMGTAGTLKCISICQPFVELVLSGKKPVVLTRWTARVIGEILLYSSRRIDKNNCKRFPEIEAKRQTGELVTGAIVGKANLVNIKKYKSDIELEEDFDLHLVPPEQCNYGTGNAKVGRTFYGFKLEDVKRLREPIPYKGRWSIFDADLPKLGITDADLVSDIVNEEHRYQWVGRH